MDQRILEVKEMIFHDIHYRDIAILENKVNFIVGSSGAGKTTLLKLFNATYTPESGEILYRGEDIEGIDTIRLRKEILLASQTLYLFDDSIKDNFIQFYEYRGEPVPSDDTIEKFLEICCVPFSIDHDCTRMSGGEKQRVYMAILLSFCPKVLILDEPTSALDKDNSQMVMKNITVFCKENDVTLVVVSHDGKITEAFAENIITLQGGKRNEGNY